MNKLGSRPMTNEQRHGRARREEGMKQNVQCSFGEDARVDERAFHGLELGLASLVVKG
jgi:hypothetical protein